MPAPSNNLIVLAAFWNESQFVEAALGQLRAINPAEIIFSDGCFDPNFSKNSNDGTLEALQDFVNVNSNAQLVSPIRRSRAYHIGSLLRWMMASHTRLSKQNLRWLLSYRSVSLYRLNQAATFNMMLRKSKVLKPGSWVTTYDADEFFPQTAVTALGALSKSAIFDRVLTQEVILERTEKGNSFRPSSLLRTWNTPHKVLSELRFFPTRQLWRPEYGLSENQTMGSTTDYFLGPFIHYKTRTPERATAAYLVGDREPPRLSQGQHPVCSEILTTERAHKDLDQLSNEFKLRRWGEIEKQPLN